MSTNNRQVTLKTDHIFHMTDDTGMLQHAIFGVPNRSEGYTSDDNSRALIMAVSMYEQYHVEKYEKLIYLYVSFLRYAQNANGTFRNFMGYNREFFEREGSEDCFGRCLWALCYAYKSIVTPQNVKKTVGKMIEKSLPNCLKLVSPRAKAYAVIGLTMLSKVEASGIVSSMATSLADQYDRYSDGDWHWFEDSMTYGNAVLPWAMFSAYKTTKEIRYQHIGFESLKFLDKKTSRNGYFKPIGCNGWLTKGKEPAEFDEQPIEACEATLAFLEAYSVSGDTLFLEKAKTCFSWFRGNNAKNLFLIDAETGGCYDGIGSEGINQNQGAESVLSFWMAYLAIRKSVLNIKAAAGPKVKAAQAVG